MSEPWIRLALVFTVVALATSAAAVVRRRLVRSPVGAGATSLGPGLYLFSSGDCLDCRAARAMIEQALGAEGFHEVAWEDDPTAFEALGITVVPATVVVADGGSATVYPGMPDAAIRALGP